MSDHLNTSLKNKISSSILAACLLSPFLAAAHLHAAEPVRVFLFAGQSNMVGADTEPDDVKNFPLFQKALEPLKDVRYSFQIGPQHKSNGWTDLQCVGKDFGPEFTFARALRQHCTDPMAIIKDAWGGTTLVSDWAPDGGDEKSRKLYQRFITQVRDRLAELGAKGEKHRIQALMWHQGENDMFHAQGKLQYEKNLRKFIASVRKDLKVPKLKVFIGEISTKGVWGMDNRANVALIRNAQQAVVASDPNVFFVPTSHLSFRVGHPVGLHYHFGSLGQLQHGVAYANAYLKNSVEYSGKAKEAVTKRPVPQKLPKAKKVKLFVLGGQRNMEGEEAWLAELAANPKSAELLKPQAALFQYSLGQVTTSVGWEYLAPVNHLGDFGPELSFGRRMIPKMKRGEVLAIYKFTDSGSQSLDWLPEGSKETYRDRYHAWIAGIKQCRADLTKQGYECEIPAIFWHCGENDRALSWMAKEYTGRFQRFMEATRRDLDLPDLTWVLTEQPMLPASISGKQKLYDLNADLEALAAKDPHLHFVKTSDLPHRPVLFGTQGIIALGDRMAESWEEINKH